VTDGFEDLHRKVKAQAALEGKTLKQYVLDTLQAAVTEKKPKPKPKR
jgi:predicted HicB family RNase H-like nuclease